VATSQPPQPEVATELPLDQLLGWLRRHQVKLAWTGGLIFLAVVLVLMVQRHRGRTLDKATESLAATAGVEGLRRLAQDFGHTSQGPHIRLRLARALLDAEAQLDAQPSGGDDLYERKLAHLREAVEVLDRLQDDWTDAKLGPLVQHLLLEANKELRWEQRYGRRYLPRDVKPRAGKALGELVAAPANPVVAFHTKHGVITCELFEDQAPNSVANFLALTAEGFYDGLTFHRVGPKDDSTPGANDGVPAVIQGGCPKGDGTGDPGYKINTELSATLDFEAGTLCWANSGLNTEGSQFFICKEKIDQPSWKQSYARFGKVVEGLDVVQKVVKGDVIEKIEILKRRGTAAEFPYRPRVLGIPDEAAPAGGTPGGSSTPVGGVTPPATATPPPGGGSPAGR
jgi:peptidyl-prolyl cis-trans isomerase B (cyclophilin B)